ncbi:4,4'-diaponeurosporenoate glycosyltransferase [Bacillus mesophilus]|uniref:4,4'-diaponeurosporenoate glycosyltransferase n=1 Tax=Bacillus mesophilus TaxID=1808955 RepID=A0A6M0QAP3_9BACI|nr:glycosyltransferase [Bacillus mesophilus]MBM7662826.1 4,4'-diaponeurosporenoate glycosyltransferase [Bacillus mesophilus]NEY73416.1 glycosyltransferase [Bacillus mesophilus]
MTVLDVINLVIGFVAVMIGMIMFWSLPVPGFSSRPKESLPFLSIIIPARNEEGRISPLLQSLQEQRFSQFEILVVDDDSSDNTAAVAKSYGAKVLQNTGAGKSSACWLGAEQAKGSWLLFLDADTKFTSVDGLTKLLHFYQGKGARGITALQPFHTVERLYEHISVVFNIIVVVGMNLFTIWGSRFKTAGSFGPCILCNRDDYFLSGGHKKIEGAIMDDLELGEAFLEQNLPVRCLGGKGIMSLRMYPEGVGSLVEGWCKSFAIGSKSTHPLVMLMVIFWISGSFIAAGALISSIIEWNTTAMIFSGILYILYTIQTAWFASRVGNFRWAVFPLYPILFMFFVGIYLYSFIRVNVFHSVSWKGRKIKV